MKQRLYLWIEDYLFYPNNFQKFISFILLPFTFIYLSIILFKRLTTKRIDYNLPIISVGNLLVGGSGKTPITIALALKYKKTCIILRGYGRKTKGLFVISKDGNILTDVETSGDEAMLLAQSLKSSTIIVCENRIEGILKAKELGCKIIFLDDGFSKYHIKKFDILLHPEKQPTNNFCLPSGGYREPKSFYKYCDLNLIENEDFKRIVTIMKGENEATFPLNTVLLTGISKPKRLLKFLPPHIVLEAYPDHHEFTENDIKNIKDKYKNYSILTTYKDYVKLKKFNIKEIYLMKLDIEICNNAKLNEIDRYIKSYE